MLGWGEIYDTVYTDGVREIQCPVGFSNIQRTLYRLGIIQKQGLPTEYFLESKKIFVRDYKQMTLAAFNEFKRLGRKDITEHVPSIRYLKRESNLHLEFRTQWEKFESDPESDELEQFFLKAIHEAPYLWKTRTKEQLLFYLLSKPDEDLVEVTRWKSIETLGYHIELCKEFFLSPLIRNFNT